MFQRALSLGLRLCKFCCVSSSYTFFFGRSWKRVWTRICYLFLCLAAVVVFRWRRFWICRLPIEVSGALLRVYFYLTKRVKPNLSDNSGASRATIASALIEANCRIRGFDAVIASWYCRLCGSWRNVDNFLYFIQKYRWIIVATQQFRQPRGTGLTSSRHAEIIMTYCFDWASVFRMTTKTAVFAVPQLNTVV